MPSSMDYVLKAEDAESAGSRDEARTFAIKAINEDDTNVDALIVLARVTTDPDERQQALAKAAQLDPDHPHLATVAKRRSATESSADWDNIKQQIQSELSAEDAAKFEQGMQRLQGMLDGDPGKRKAKDVVSYDLGTSNYLLISIALLVAYWVFYPIGFIGNLWMLYRLRQPEERQRAEYSGCLYATFVTHALPALCICGLILVALFSGDGSVNVSVGS